MLLIQQVSFFFKQRIKHLLFYWITTKICLSFLYIWLNSNTTFTIISYFWITWDRFSSWFYKICRRTRIMIFFHFLCVFRHLGGENRSLSNPWIRTWRETLFDLRPHSGPARRKRGPRQARSWICQTGKKLNRLQ